MTSPKKVKHWYWYLGLILILWFLGIPQAIFMGGIELVQGHPRSAVAELANVPLNFAEWLLITTPGRIARDPAIGIGLFLGNLTPLGVGIWLMCKKPKKEEGK